MDDVISKIKPKIASIISEDSYKTWIEPIQFSEYRDEKCYVVVPNTFFRDWIVENFEPILVSLLKDVTKANTKIEYILRKEEKKEEPKGVVLKKPVTYNTFNPKYTFENFVVGASNQFANAACLAVATNPGKTYNPPFYIWRRRSR